MDNKLHTSLIALLLTSTTACAAGSTCEDDRYCAQQESQVFDEGTGGGGSTTTSSASSPSSASSAMTTSVTSTSSSGGGGDGGSGGGMPAEVDGDGDGYTLSTGDCDDTNPAIHPLAGDTFGDSIDQDCDGGDYDAVLVSTGAYYVIIPQWTDAMTAASKCVQLGYERLAEIHSHEEQIAEANLPSRDYLKKYENSQVYFGGGKRLWIGLQQKGNSFVWGSGTSSAYTSWYPSSPNGDGTCVEGDVAAHDPGFPGGGWNDIPCSQMMPFVCEKRK